MNKVIAAGSWLWFSGIPYVIMLVVVVSIYIYAPRDCRPLRLEVHFRNPDAARSLQPSLALFLRLTPTSFSLFFRLIWIVENTLSISTHLGLPQFQPSKLLPFLVRWNIP